MISQLCDSLLRRVYEPVTAIFCMDEDKRPIGMMLFDTVFGAKDWRMCAGTRCIHLICNHPEGRMTLTKEEIRNIRCIGAQAQGAALHVHIYGEDIGLFEVDSGGILDYNGENAC